MSSGLEGIDMKQLVRSGMPAVVLLVALACFGAQAVCAQEDVVERLQADAAASPARLDLLLALGNAAAATGRFDLAVASFHKVLDLMEPDSPEAGDLHLRIGETYRRKGDSEAA